MIWWKKALLATAILLVVTGAVGFVLHQKIVGDSTNTTVEEAKDNKLATFCGEIAGAGVVVIWIIAYRSRSKLS